MHLAGAVAALRERPDRTALLFDFDGTLSPTVPDPAAARPAPGVAERLDALAGRYATVGIISGRPISFLEGHLPSTVTISGQYGTEIRPAGGRARLAVDERWAEVIAEIASELAGADMDVPNGVVVEPKGLSVTIHHRLNPAAEDWVRDRAAAISRRTGLTLHDAKASVELRPPVDVDKGTVARALADGSDAVLYIGDDVGDLPALEAVRSMDGAGCVGIPAVVDGPELPGTLRDVAALVLDGIEGPGSVVDLLEGLVAP